MNTPSSIDTLTNNLHSHSVRHREEILNSEMCGCFYCLHTFPPSAIDEWWDEREEDGIGQTAVCPECGIDAVIGDACGHAITPELLQALKEKRFWK